MEQDAWNQNLGSLTLEEDLSVRGSIKVCLNGKDHPDTVIPAQVCNGGAHGHRIIALYLNYLKNSQLGPILFYISIHDFDSGTACALRSFTDDILLEGSVIVLCDTAAVGGTLTSWRNGLTNLLWNSTREKAVPWDGITPCNSTWWGLSQKAAGGPSGQQAAKVIKHILGCSSKSVASRTREMLLLSVWHLCSTICKDVCSFGLLITRKIWTHWAHWRTPEMVRGWSMWCRGKDWGSWACWGQRRDGFRKNLLLSTATPWAGAEKIKPDAPERCTEEGSEAMGRGCRQEKDIQNPTKGLQQSALSSELSKVWA